MRTRLLVCLLWVVLASPVSAAGVDLAWDACLGDPGALSLKTFACDNNVGQDPLLVSFVPAVSMPSVTTIEIALDFRTRSGVAMPAWWEVGQPDGCRRGLLSVDPDLQVHGPSCEAWLTSLVTPGFVIARFDIRTPTPDVAHMVVLAHPTSSSVVAGSHYVGCRMLLGHAGSVGTITCAGCREAVDITLSAVRLATSTSEQVLTLPQTSNHVQWQLDRPVATRATTWGAVKALYR
jgi:hypothetical protein